MSDENCDPSSVSAKIHSTTDSSVDNSKSTEITNASQRLPATSVEESVNEHSKIDSSEATHDLTHLLHINTDNTTIAKHLNPDAPDFKPIDFTSTYRSELAPSHRQRRRATQVEFYDDHHSRARYYSDAHQNEESITSINTSTIKPLLSIAPQYIPRHRKSWSTTTPSLLSNSWNTQEYSNASSAAASYHSKPVHQLYSPLMQQQLLTDDDDDNYSYNQQQNKNTSRRTRTFSGRPFVYSNQSTTSRKRSHSGPQTPLQSRSIHLNGIHSLTRIMVDLLRMISPISDEHKQQYQSILSSSSNLTSSASVEQQQSLQKENQSSKSIEAEDACIDDNISTATVSLLPLSINKAAGSFILIKLFSLDLLQF
jgi:hypothetical protein